MAHSRATTPARGITPARGMNPNTDRQRGTTPSAATGHRTTTASATKCMNISMANGSRPGLLGGMAVLNPKPNYPKPQPKFNPDPPKASPPKKSTSGRVTRQRDGTLPGAPERLIHSAVTAVNKPKKAAARKTAAKKTAKTGAGVKKPKTKVKKNTVQKSVAKSSGSTAKPNSPNKKILSTKEAAKGPAKKVSIPRKAGVGKKCLPKKIRGATVGKSIRKR